MMSIRMEKVEPSALRSRIMARVRDRDTAPERIVRGILTDLGYRYRLHRKDLPGRPDIAFIGKRKAIFVHGCFWHGHNCKRGAREPKANADYWRAKIARNRARDSAAVAALAARGWASLTVWECDLRDREAVRERLNAFVRKPGSQVSTSLDRSAMGVAQPKQD